MDVFTLVLIPHVAAGSVGLVVGPVAMGSPKRRGLHPWAGRAYQGCVAVMTLSALGLAVLHWSALWGFAVIAVATELAALSGWWLARRRPANWVPWHVSLMCGSYLSLVTALLVVNSHSLVAWLAPTVIGSPLIARAAARAQSASGQVMSASTRMRVTPEPSSSAGAAPASKANHR